MDDAANGQGRWLFASHFFKNPKMLGSIIPSSRYLVDHLLESVDWARARYFVEYGPGVGTITREILRRMAPDAKLLTIELNPDFANYLEREFDDPRLTVHNGSAEDIDELIDDLGWDGFDYAVSGIPFSTLPKPLRDSILRKTRECMRPSGEFVAFQFSNSVLPHLSEAFERVERGFVLRNILPAHCYRCRA